MNLFHVVYLGRSAAFRSAYASQTFVTADGRPVVWLCRLAGQDVRLAAGSDLLDPIMALAAETDTPVALLGATEHTLAMAATQLCARHPKLSVVAQIAPTMDLDPDGPEMVELTDRIQASGARICVLALGTPRQEIFAAKAAQTAEGIGFLCFGAALDFIAGTQVRAPAGFRAVGAEWLWRLARDPRRMAGRYAACLAVLPRLFGTAILHRLRT
ncbi:MAG: WecB/TagA/CpsF family glycosyltransferase [Pseudomonadota bacterium]